MTDAQTIFEQIIQRLSAAALDPKHPFRTGILATVNENGAPSARTCVLRRVDQDPLTLWFHTDRRAPKVAQLRLDGRFTWLFYDPGDKVQIRLIGRAAVHTEGVDADALWADVPPPVRATYQSPHPPGTPIDQPHRNLPDAGGEAGRQHFAAVACRVDEIDYVQLDPAGHVRMRISLGCEAIFGDWEVP